MPNRRSRPLPCLLLVSTDDSLSSMLSGAVASMAVVERVDDEGVASSLIRCRPLAGLVLDMALLGRSALALAREFLAQQASGHVVLIAGEHGPATLIGINLRDVRVEYLVRPVDADALRNRFASTPAAVS